MLSLLPAPALEDPDAAWARSGGMALTGRSDGPPLSAPPTVMQGVAALTGAIEDAAADLDSSIELDGAALLGERAALAGFGRHGAISCGQGTRLLRAADAWLAVSLARPDDVAAVPAWLERPVSERGQPLWDEIGPAVAVMPATTVVERAQLLGLPVARLGEAASGPPHVQPGRLPVTASRVRDAARSPLALGVLRIVDLSSLWAGPLCAHLLQLAGAEVVKVESVGRPDGARFGTAAFFDLLHAGQRSVALDWGSASGRAALRALLASADVVIESSRPRALAQLGISATEVLQQRCRVWVSITGHGRGVGGHRVGFGDDAAVAGGLVVWDERGPCFCADAIADPVAGLVATAAALRALASGGHWLVDVALAKTAEWLAGPNAAELFRGRAADRDGRLQTRSGPVPVRPPRARAGTGRAAPLGAQTQAVLGELLSTS